MYLTKHVYMVYNIYRTSETGRKKPKGKNKILKTEIERTVKHVLETLRFAEQTMALREFDHELDVPGSKATWTVSRKPSSEDGEAYTSVTYTDGKSNVTYMLNLITPDGTYMPLPGQATEAQLAEIHRDLPVLKSGIVARYPELEKALVIYFE
jgi:hypothetical protein